MIDHFKTPQLPIEEMAVTVDAQRLQRVQGNLLANALKSRHLSGVIAKPFDPMPPPNQVKRPWLKEMS